MTENATPAAENDASDYLPITRADLVEWLGHHAHGRDCTAASEAPDSECDCWRRPVADLLEHPGNVAKHDSAMWLNGFKCIRPTDEFLTEVGRDLIQSACRVPGHTLVKVSIT